jgi:hypothetical protein
MKTGYTNLLKGILTSISFHKKRHFPNRDGRLLASVWRSLKRLEKLMADFAMGLPLQVLTQSTKKKTGR